MSTRLGDMNTNKSWSDSLSELREEFRKWGIEDYALPIRKESQAAGRVKVTFAINGQWCSPECRRWGPLDGPTWLEKNLRAIVTAIRSARLADQRGIGSLLAEATRHLALKSGDVDPYQVLGVHPAASADELQQAYRRRVRQTHPDTGGDPTAFKATHEAAEKLGIR